MEEECGKEAVLSFAVVGAVADFPGDEEANMVVAHFLVAIFKSSPFSPTALWILWHLQKGWLTPQRVFLMEH